MYAYEHAAQHLGIDSEKMHEAMRRGHIRAKREASRSRDGAVVYQPVSEAGGLFQSIRGGYISPLILKLGSME